MAIAAFESKLPDGTFDPSRRHNNHHYVIVPARKQYAELTAEATGEQMEKLMTPDQLVEDLRGLAGIERAGEGPMNGRVAEKYRYEVLTWTKCQGCRRQSRKRSLAGKGNGTSECARKAAATAGLLARTRAVIEMRHITKKSEIETSEFRSPR